MYFWIEAGFTKPESSRLFNSFSSSGVQIGEISGSPAGRATGGAATAGAATGTTAFGAALGAAFGPAGPPAGAFCTPLPLPATGAGP